VTVRKLRPPVPHDLASAAVTVIRRRQRAFLGLGSNLGDRWGHLRAAVEGLPDVAAVSAVYETEPVGGPDGQDRYLNAVVELRTNRTPRQLLEAAHAAEARADRVRAERWGPRTLDVDVLLFGDQVVVEEGLVVPHARMWERGFVLVPLADLAPELAGPVLTQHPDLGDGVSRAGTL
jgi:2-amino-4-hydroxy-6-hydroxymethyldihydropteridine diphosphokinase